MYKLQRENFVTQVRGEAHQARTRAAPEVSLSHMRCSSYFYSSNSHYTEAIADWIDFFSKSSQEALSDALVSTVSTIDIQPSSSYYYVSSSCLGPTHLSCGLCLIRMPILILGSDVRGLHSLDTAQNEISKNGILGFVD